MPRFISGRLANTPSTGPAAGSVDDQLYQILRAHLLDNGWEELDVNMDAPGSRDIVFAGAPLHPAAGNRPIVRLTLSHDDWVIFFTGYSEWDITNKRGILRAADMESSTQWAGIRTRFDDPPTQDEIEYFIRANPVSCVITVKELNGGEDTGLMANAYFGFPMQCLPPTHSGVGILAAPVAPGATSAQLTADVTGTLTPGQYLVILNRTGNFYDPSSHNVEGIRLTSIVGNTIHFDCPTSPTGQLRGQYSAGALVGFDPVPLIVTRYNLSHDAWLSYIGYSPYNPISGNTSTWVDEDGFVYGYGEHVFEDIQGLVRSLYGRRSSFDYALAPVWRFFASETPTVIRGVPYHYRVSEKRIPHGSYVEFPDGRYMAIYTAPGETVSDGTNLVRVDD